MGKSENYLEPEIYSLPSRLSRARAVEQIMFFANRNHIFVPFLELPRLQILFLILESLTSIFGLHFINLIVESTLPNGVVCLFLVWFGEKEKTIKTLRTCSDIFGCYSR